ncbi:haloacid dehalogenase [Bifidobacterium sp. DSM 109960]|uniref:Haloacid dehalogenase n=1 Tax=Bifidobacterium erythrocebi TaxID=2675325 RepID=A0A7Y0HUK2_9BIFI|nr:haloacid dehalogenase-like hydrolase [Bifidobacterium sp. DSM 109960]NMM96256.1 haloacid dehalogenase [Bifidobacterium sp. DSM 109960]
MRVFDFDGTIYDGESLFDLYLFSLRYEPKALRFIAPVLRYAVKYKLGRASFEQMERGVRGLCDDYLRLVARSVDLDRLVAAFWTRNMKRIKPWYEPRPDDVILTASFDLTVGEACRRLGIDHVIGSVIDPESMAVEYLNFNINKPKRFRELYGEGVVIDEFYTDSRFDQPMIDIARHAYMVKGNKVTQVK